LLPAPASAEEIKEPFEFSPGRTDLISVATDGSPANGDSGPSAVSAGGRFVAFLSNAPDLVPGDKNGLVDVFVRDRVAETTEVVSVSNEGKFANGTQGSFTPSISDDGRYVAFASDASNLVPGDTNNATDVFVHDRALHTTERVSVSDDGAQGGNGSFHPEISGDGRYVVFDTIAANLLGGSPSSYWQILVRDLVQDTNRLASQSSTGVAGNGFSLMPNISTDGRYVVFLTDSTNLSTDDGDGWPDVVLRDTLEGITERVSFAADGGQPNDGPLNVPSVSDDGRFVSFLSRGTNHVPADSNAVGNPLRGHDLFVYDRQLDRTQRVSVASSGAEPAGISLGYSSIMSADGRSFAFESEASNLVLGDENGMSDVFVHQPLSGTTSLISRTDAGAQGNERSVRSALSPDGRHVAFSSLATNLAAGVDEGTLQLYVRDLGPAIGAGGIATSPSADGLDISGWVNIEGGVFASGNDPAGDSADGGASGSDLVGASIAYRPQTADLLFSWRTDSLPSAAVPSIPPNPQVSAHWTNGENGSAAVPAVAFVTAFETAGPAGATHKWEVRASGSSLAPTFSLHYCSVSPCQEFKALTGGIGAAGHEVRVRMPLAAPWFSNAPGDELRAIRVSVAPLASGVPSPMDSLDLGQATIPTSHVSLGWAPPDAQAGQIAFPYAARIIGNRFEATVDKAPSMDAELWIRTCFEDKCSVRATATH
jgi:Tol biopolymer transport system component